MNIPRKLPDVQERNRGKSTSILLQPPVKAVGTTRQLRRLHALFAQEIALLQKIRYKQKNQHKSATWWRHVTGSERIAKRFQAEFVAHVLPVLPDVSSPESKPALEAARFPRTAESCLRLLLLVEHAASINIKAASALEQLLKAALFMPLALTMKAIIARLAGLLELFQAELLNLLGILRETSKKNASIASGLDRIISKLSQGLRKYWDTGKPKKRKRATSATAPSDIALPAASPPQAVPNTPLSVVVNAAAPTSPSLEQIHRVTEAVAKPVEAAPSLVPAKRRSEEVQIEKAASTQPESVTRGAMAPEATEPAPPAKKAKVKKRKKVQGDDIDAIFAGF